MRRYALCELFLIAVLGSSLAACSDRSNRLPEKLRLEEHALSAVPELDPLTFQPFGTTQETVLAQHAVERAMGFPSAALIIQDNPALSSLGDKSDLVAVLKTSSQNPLQQRVELLRGDEVVFTANAGLPSPVLPLQGLWTYDNHWALEILLADASVWAGEVFIDGELINQVKGYDEAYSFQLLAGRPFFFYQREGHAGFSYDGQETDLNYDVIPHYRCCSESSLNPLQAQGMVAFFAQRGEKWFYVEIGKFNP